MKKLLFVTCIAVIILSSCDLLLELLGGLGGSKTFWAVDTTKNSSDYNYYYQLTASLLAENDYCKVYAETSSGVTEATAEKVADEYIKIYNKMMNAFGLEFDVKYTNGTTGKLDTLKYADALTDGDGKLTILLLDIKDGYRKGVNESYVAGYFTAINFFSDNPSSGYRSNACDMIYIDTDPALTTDPTGCYSTLAHELQHLMNFVTTLEKRVVYDAKGEVEDIFLMDTWIDEGLASAAEWVYTGKTLDDRLSWYYNNGGGEGAKKITSLIDKGNNFFVWDNREGEGEGKSIYANLDDYATVYLFFQWLRIQSNNGQNIYKEIIGSSKGDYMAVTDAASARISSSYNNGNWERLLGDWLAANYINNTSGIYGYKGDNDLIKIKGRHLQSTNAKNINLYPGEGVYSKINGYYSKPSNIGYIRYSLLTDTGISPDSFITSGALLTYNANPINFIMGSDDRKKDPNPEPGVVTGIAASVTIDIVNGRSVAGVPMFSGPYRIGAGEVRRGGDRSLPTAGILQFLNSLTLREE
jgi:hypothetical protein